SGTPPPARHHGAITTPEEHEMKYMMFVCTDTEPNTSRAAIRTCQRPRLRSDRAGSRRQLLAHGQHDEGIPPAGAGARPERRVARPDEAPGARLLIAEL